MSNVGIRKKTQTPGFGTVSLFLFSAPFSVFH